MSQAMPKLTRIYLFYLFTFVGFLVLLAAGGAVAARSLASAGTLGSLHGAVRNGKTLKVKLLLGLGADPNELNDEGKAPLHVAALYDRPGMARLLIEHGAEVDMPAGNGLTPLAHAVVLNHPGTAKVLLEAGADPNHRIPSGQVTPLHLARVAGQDGIADLLIAHGADESLLDELGRTPARAAEIMRGSSGLELIPAASAEVSFDPRAIVRIMYWGRRWNSELVKTPRIGFVLEGSSLVVTDNHCIDDFVDNATEAILVKPLVVSSFLGDLAEAEIVARDPWADLAILRIPWEGHPGLELASKEEIERATGLFAASYPPTDSSAGDKTLSREVCVEFLPLLSTNPEGGNRALLTDGARYSGPGWSGSPFVVPETGRVAGGLVLLQPVKIGDLLVSRNLSGWDADALRRLLGENGLSIDESKVLGSHTQAAGATEAFSAVMEMFDRLPVNDGIRAASAAERLIELHPDSIAARTAMSWIATWQSVHDEVPGLAESAFREAHRLGEDNIRVRAARADYLVMVERYEEALRESDRALEIEPGNRFARLTRLRELRNLDTDRAEAYGRSLVEESLGIPDYWNELANVYEALGKYSEQADALMKAEGLLPPPLPRGPVAHALAKAGRLDEAEERFKRNVTDHNCQWCWFAYAKFLIEHRPERPEDARTALAKVEEMSAQGLIEESEIDAWRERLAGGGESSNGE